MDDTQRKYYAQKGERMYNTIDFKSITMPHVSSLDTVRLAMIEGWIHKGLDIDAEDRAFYASHKHGDDLQRVS